MNNVETKIVGDKLTITIDIGKKSIDRSETIGRAARAHLVASTN